MRKVYHSLAILALIMALYGCTSYQSYGIETDDPGHIISIRDYHFNPPQVRVTQGSLITWKNLDVDRHSINFNERVSPQLKRGQTWTINATEIGTFEYHSDNHPFIKGTIIVTRPPEQT